MELMLVDTFGVALITGFLVQYILRWSPQVNLAVTFIAILILPPVWSIGFSTSLWLCCAFLTYHPQHEHFGEQSRGWLHVVICSFFTFFGFILTLLLLWRVKIGSVLMMAYQREILAWLYLAILEISFYKIIALTCPKWSRFHMGYGIGFFNTLMLLYWVYPYGLAIVALTFFTLLVVNPLLLFWVDRPLNQEDQIFKGGHR